MYIVLHALGVLLVFVKGRVSRAFARLLTWPDAYKKRVWFWLGVEKPRRRLLRPAWNLPYPKRTLSRYLSQPFLRTTDAEHADFVQTVLVQVVEARRDEAGDTVFARFRVAVIVVVVGQNVCTGTRESLDQLADGRARCRVAGMWSLEYARARYSRFTNSQRFNSGRREPSYSCSEWKNARTGRTAKRSQDDRVLRPRVILRDVRQYAIAVVPRPGHTSVSLSIF